MVGLRYLLPGGSPTKEGKGKWKIMVWGGNALTRKHEAHQSTRKGEQPIHGRIQGQAEEEGRSPAGEEYGWEKRVKTKTPD